MKKKVLVVDDSKFFREALISELLLDDLSAFEAGTGDEALELIKAHSPDLILLDINLKE